MTYELYATLEVVGQETFNTRQITLVMTFLGYKTHLKTDYQSNIKRLTTQTILANDVVFIETYKNI